MENDSNCTMENLVFLSKVFFDNTASSCPVITPIVTNDRNFSQQLIIGDRERDCDCDCDCGCRGNRDCDFNLCNAKFTVTNSCVTVTSALQASNSTFSADDVTIDGFPVTDLDFQNGRYFADLSGIMADITRCPCTPRCTHICDDGCQCRRDCKKECDNDCDRDGHFFLAEVPGPWELLFTIVLEGFVSNGSCTRDFKLCIKTRNDSSGRYPVTIRASNNFGIQCVEIPCQSQGIAPALRFNFEGCAMLLNPIVSVSTESEDNCPSRDITVRGNLVFTPRINLQVVRPSLFALNAQEVDICCDNLGQCDPCAPHSDRCADRDCDRDRDRDRDRDCDRDRNDNNGRRRRRGEANERAQIPACQCCETNGFRF